MQIIVRRTKTFISGGQILTVSPEPFAQTVPGWVRTTPTFQLGSQDGSVSEVEIKPPVAMAPVAAPAAPAPSPVRGRKSAAKADSTEDPALIEKP